MSEGKNEYKSYQTVYKITPPPKNLAWNLEGKDRDSVEVTLGLQTYEHLKESSAEKQRRELEQKLRLTSPSSVVELKKINTLDDVLKEIKQ